MSKNDPPAIVWLLAIPMAAFVTYPLAITSLRQTFITGQYALAALSALWLLLAISIPLAIVTLIAFGLIDLVRHSTSYRSLAADSYAKSIRKWVNHLTGRSPTPSRRPRLKIWERTPTIRRPRER